MIMNTRRLVPILILALGPAFLFRGYFTGRVQGEPVLCFCGGAREVGGSCLLVECGKERFIVDCGDLGAAGKGIIPPDPSSLSFALVTHAHLDHCGLLPELYGAGFRGIVYCTEPTAELIPIMLGMRIGMSREKSASASLDSVAGGLVPVPYGETVDIGSISFRFGRAEHLLGAAFVEIWFDNDTKLIVSGDLGSGNSMLLPPLESPERADYVVMESTYGGITREGRPGGLHYRFAESVGEALSRGGDVLVPAFTLGRTQEVLAALQSYSRAGVIPQGVEIFVDSPTARKINGVFRNFREELSSWARGFYGADVLWSGGLREVRSRTALKQHSRTHNPTVFISSSGDLEHANSPKHFMRMYGDTVNLLCVVGWQRDGSLCDRLLDGEDPVLVRYRSAGGFREEWICPALEVQRFDSFSAHADQNGLLGWLNGIGGVRDVFLVHGELDQARALARAIGDRMHVCVRIPEPGEWIVLRRAPDAGLAYVRDEAGEYGGGVSAGDGCSGAASMKEEEIYTGR